MDNPSENDPIPKSKKQDFFIKYWWVFPIACVLCSLIILPLVNYDWWGLVSLFAILSIFLLVLQIAIFFLCLFDKKWWCAVGAGFCGIVCYFVLSINTFVVLAVASSQPDSFGKEHPIPEGTEYNIPLKEGEALSETMIDSLSEDSYLQIWNSFQDGIYQYNFYYPALPDGKLFLRCYEVTDNIELSASRLKTASTVEVKNHNQFGLIVDKQKFTIYEGDWDDYYLARVEVWFKDAKTHKETKLLEKIYRVEGWTR